MTSSGLSVLGFAGIRFVGASLIIGFAATALADEVTSPQLSRQQGVAHLEDLVHELSTVHQSPVTSDKSYQLGMAITELGELYASGEVGGQEGQRILQYYLRLLDEIDVAAQVSVVSPKLLFRGGGDGARNAMEAVRCYEYAASLGYAEAFLKLGDTYFDGILTERNLPQTFGFYVDAARLGSVTGRLRAGQMLTKGLGTDRNLEIGAALIRQAADLGSIEAMLELGDLHASPTSGMTDGTSAIAAYERAAKLGSPEALLRLGDLYRDGRAVPVSGAKAVAYYLHAVEAGQRATPLEP